MNHVCATFDVFLKSSSTTCLIGTFGIGQLTRYRCRCWYKWQHHYNREHYLQWKSCVRSWCDMIRILRDFWATLPGGKAHQPMVCATSIVKSIKAHPHLYANGNEACGMEANVNECQKVAKSDGMGFLRKKLKNCIWYPIYQKKGYINFCRWTPPFPQKW